MTTIFFSPLSIVAVFGSEIRGPGWVKIRIRIRDKHPGSATLAETYSTVLKPFSNGIVFVIFIKSALYTVPYGEIV
jgi:hypothetical protein